MTDKELRKLRRAELLELLVSLSEENEALQKKIDLLNEKLESRTIQMQESGSIAEAALKVSGVFEAAQNAADHYLENIRQLNGNAQKKADDLIAEAQRKCAAIEAETAANVDKKWNSVKEQLDHYCETRLELQEEIGSLYRDIEEKPKDAEG